MVQADALSRSFSDLFLKEWDVQDKITLKILKLHKELNHRKGIRGNLKKILQFQNKNSEKS